MKFVKENIWSVITLVGFILFIACSLMFDFAPGQKIGNDFGDFFIQMFKILPPVFILIGLFDVWVPTETVEKHLGHGSGFLAYLWAILLAGSTVGGLHVAFPIAHALYLKRARLGVVITFLSACGVCRIPMTLFEASILGWRFTLVRFAVSLPLIIITSALTGWYLEKQNYQLPSS